MTEDEKKEVCLVLANYNFFQKVSEQLNEHFALKNVWSMEKATAEIRQGNVLCLIAKVKENNDFTPLQISGIIRQFPIIPTIALLDGSNFDLIYSCFKIGITEIVSITKLDKLKEKVFLVVNSRQLRGGVHELGIDVSNCSERVRRALEIIEKNHTKIKYADDAANIFDINLATLSREFSKECNVHLLPFIYFLKFREAVCLMKNPGFHLKNIIEIAGFINKVQFNRWFKKFIGMTPQEFREKKTEINFTSVFDKKVRKKS